MERKAGLPQQRTPSRPRRQLTNRTGHISGLLPLNELDKDKTAPLKYESYREGEGGRRTRASLGQTTGTSSSSQVEMMLDCPVRNTFFYCLLGAPGSKDHQDKKRTGGSIGSTYIAKSSPDQSCHGDHSHSFGSLT